MATTRKLSPIEARALSLLNDVLPVLEKIEVRRAEEADPNLGETYKLHNTLKEIRTALHATNQMKPLRASLKDLALPNHGD